MRESVGSSGSAASFMMLVYELQGYPNLVVVSLRPADAKLAIWHPLTIQLYVAFSQVCSILASAAYKPSMCSNSSEVPSSAILP